MPRPLNEYLREMRRDLDDARRYETGYSQFSQGGEGGTQFTPSYETRMQCFEIRSEWKAVKQTGHPGPSQGTNWVATGWYVGYWNTVDDSGQSATYWRKLPEVADVQLEDIWYGITAYYSWQTPAQDLSAPTFGIGDWVWCIFDYEAGVWRLVSSVGGTSTNFSMAILKTDLLAGGTPVYAEVLDEDWQPTGEYLSVYDGSMASGAFAAGAIVWVERGSRNKVRGVACINEMENP